MTKPTRLCSIDDCGGKHQARGFCSSHYNLFVAGPDRHPSIEKTCCVCGKIYATKRTQGRYCSYLCRSADPAYSSIISQGRTKIVNHCATCATRFHGGSPSAKYCSDACRPSPKTQDSGGPVDRRNPLRAAYEDDLGVGAFLAVLRPLCSITSTECWKWNGRVDKSGYPVHSLGGSGKDYVHRAVLEVKLGKRLGRQPAHHICANAICVNPDHLQLVTQRENAAEMLERNWMVLRIRELEDALRGASPGHPILNEASVQMLA